MGESGIPPETQAQRALAQIAESPENRQQTALATIINVFICGQFLPVIRPRILTPPTLKLGFGVGIVSATPEISEIWLEAGELEMYNYYKNVKKCRKSGKNRKNVKNAQKTL